MASPAVSFHLPSHRHSWIVAQNEPGTATKSYIDSRFTEVKGVVDDATKDFNKYMQEIGEKLIGVTEDNVNLYEGSKPYYVDSSMTCKQVGMPLNDVSDIRTGYKYFSTKEAAEK